MSPRQELSTYIKSTIKGGLNDFLKRRGKEIVPTRLVYEWQRAPVNEPSFNASDLPQDAVQYLLPDNSKLIELQRRYAACDRAVTTPLLWREGHVRSDDIKYFRGDNAYVWQLRGMNQNILGYALTYYYVKSMDSLGLLGRLKEDDLFGNVTFAIDGRVISRDLLDSIIEIYFLERHLQVFTRPGLRILDIGAGYGRLAHRITEVFPDIREYLCTDGVAISTFICDYYLRFRGLASRASVVPLDEIEEKLQNDPVDLAVNIHSFSECSFTAIDWWIRLLSRCGVRHLMIIPNDLHTGIEKLDFQPVIEKYGYQLIAKDPKYRDPIVQQYAISPTYYFLFKLD